MKIAMIGGARCTVLMDGIRSAFGPESLETVTVITDVGGDLRLNNLQICLDLDACLRAAADRLDPTAGGDQVDDTFAVATALAELGAEAPWLRVADRDIATALVRTHMLDAGYGLADITTALRRHWQIASTVLPSSDDRVETHVIVDRSMLAPSADDESTGMVAIHRREWELLHHAAVPVAAVTSIGAQTAAPAPGVTEALAEAELILVADDNPVTVTDAITAIPGIRYALRDATAPIVAVCPDLELAGDVRHTLTAVGRPPTAQGVAEHLGARHSGGLLDALLLPAGGTADVDGLVTRAAAVGDDHADLIRHLWEMADVTR